MEKNGTSPRKIKPITAQKKKRRGFAMARQSTMKGMIFIGICLLLSFVVAGCGNDLSRSQAEEAIKKTVGKRPITKEMSLGNDNRVIRYTYYSKENYVQEHQQNSLGKKLVEDSNRYLALSEKGLLTYKAVATFHDDAAERMPNPSSLFYYDEYVLELTPKAKPYVIKEWVSRGFVKGLRTSDVKVLLAEVDKVEVTGISKPSDAMGQKICQASYTVRYKPTPFGEVFMRPEQLVQHGSMFFVLYDDGWRIMR
jgi:hypothetical protein